MWREGRYHPNINGTMNSLTSHIARKIFEMFFVRGKSINIVKGGLTGFEYQCSP